MKSLYSSSLKNLNPKIKFPSLINSEKKNVLAPPVLLGPPELRRWAPQPPQSPLEPAPQKQQQPAASSDPFMSLMLARYNCMPTYTENWSPTFASTGNPCLDFFFRVVPDTPSKILKYRLRSAWAHDPLTTLKLVCNLRGVRGTGKSDKEGFYTAALWLHKNHPKTLASNVDSFAEFGYFKDLLEILYRILEGSEVRDIQKAELARGRRQCRIRKSGTLKSVPRETRIAAAEKRNQEIQEKASELRKEKRMAMAKKVLERHSTDPNFKFLYEQVSDYFADCLKNDMKSYESGKSSRVSFAAKWCPSLDSSYDLTTLICESIAKKVFPRENYPEYEEIEEDHYTYRVRNRLRKQVLVPLRRVLELPEAYMSANKWDLLPYNRVHSVAMEIYKDKFLKHDEERFNEFLGQVKEGKAKIAAGALLPHRIINSLRDGDGGQVAELQWKRMVDDLKKEGSLSNCMAVCDVSGSMGGIPLEVSVALGILVSELSEDPWKGKLITFSERPELQNVEGDDLNTKTKFVENMNWDMNTDFQKVFDRILEVAVEGNLNPEQMIKRLFVFSDMEFDRASINPWETDYQAIVRKYTENGYGSVVPQIVFWKLRHSRATPVTRKQQGVALVSGFSKNMIKMFLNNDGEINPEIIMEAAISRKEYHKLVVID
ncbi:hypothetical protein LWI28_000965 [Acer negundo]|uniref:Uncharacterized protein n=1 Tax=Acer negundo TaxID=4023 RepID=A0AAD5IKY7_ACENE|nr:hypothetical protein LWI28_000965 [Acer negundo]KAK4842336.1 hypothetical protein QYF36_019794 [Acer negundo]